MGYAITTEGVRRPDQLEFWSEQAISRYFVQTDVAFGAGSGSGFRARMRGFGFGGWSVNDLVSDPIRVNRTAVLARSDPADYIQVSIMRTGKALIMQDGRCAVQSSRDEIVLIDPSAPYIFEFERPSRQVQLQIPRDEVATVLPEFASRTATTIRGDSGTGRLAAQLLCGVADYRADRGDEIAYSAVSAAVRVLAAAIREQAEPERNADPSEELLIRAQQLLADRIADPDGATVSKVAGALSVSERYVYRLFERIGTTPQRWLRDLRLTTARRMIVDPVGRMPISVIGRAVGYRSAAHFSRAFSARFGAPPREVRAGP
ncbi:MAG: helix-turn-helix domain-containing protein [Microbacterium sp.]